MRPPDPMLYDGHDKILCLRPRSEWEQMSADASYVGRHHGKTSETCPDLPGQ